MEERLLDLVDQVGRTQEGMEFLGITVSMVSSTITVYFDNILHSMLKNSPYCLLDYCPKTASKRTHAL